MKKGESTVYEYESYLDVDMVAKKLGSALIKEKLLAETSEGKVDLRLIGIFSKNRR